MAAPKKVFFGTLFDFTEAGAKEFLTSLSEQFDQVENAPFVSYDKKTKLFSYEVPPYGSNLIPSIRSRIGSYLENNVQKPYEPFELEKIIPIKGTVLQDEETTKGVRQLENNTLFDVESSSENGSGTDIEEANILYWKPKCDRISNLDTDTAAKIADSTGTHLVPDVVRQRVRLVHGNPQLALEKLQNLEDILYLTGSHDPTTFPRVNAHLLLLKPSYDLTIKFVRPVQPCPAFDRILLQPTQAQLFDQILIAESRIPDGAYRNKPPNLDLINVSDTAGIGRSEFFHSFTLPKVGDLMNAEPRVHSKEVSQTPDQAQDTSPPSKYLSQLGTGRVEEWRDNIDPAAAPTLPPAEPLPDQVQSSSRRVLAMSSSSEDDESEDDKSDTDGEDDDGDNVQQHPKQTTVSHEGWPEIVFPVDNTFQRDIQTMVQASSGSVREVAEQEDHPEDNEQQSTGRSSGAESGSIFVAPGRQVQTQIHSTAFKSAVRLIDFDSDSEAGVSDEPKSIANSFQTSSPTAKLQQSTVPARDQSSSSQSPAKSSNSGFDASNYGVKTFMSRSQSEPKGWRVIGSSKPKNNISNSVSTTPRRMRFHNIYPAEDADQIPRGPQYGYRGGELSPSRRLTKDLIDVTTDEPETASTMPPPPPPGFNYRSSDSPPSTSSPSVSSREPGPQPPISPAPPQSILSNASPGGSPLHRARPPTMDYNIQFTKPKRNVHYLRNQAITRMKAQLNVAVESDSDDNPKNRLPPNRKQEGDDHSTRKYHDTMSQKMAKPAKKKKHNNENKTETKAERDKRIAAVKAEAYGDGVFSKKVSSNLPQPARGRSENSSPSKGISAKKLEVLKKNSKMAELHPDVLEEQTNATLANQLLKKLDPVLKATRAFKGVITVEIQLGQAMIMQDQHLDERSVYTPRDFLRILNDDKRVKAAATFTNMLTTNGQDIDRMLRMKGGTVTPQMWSDPSNDNIATIIEFGCQDMAGQPFVLTLDQHGEHRLNKPTAKISHTAIHTPSQIWDACVVVAGTMPILHPSDDIRAGVEQFRQNLYLQGGDTATAYYRLPSNNSFSIRSIILKRTSTHTCLLPDKDDVKLRLTEVKILSHGQHPQDKSLHRSHESNYETMLGENRIHYKAAIVSQAVENSFTANPDIEIGDLAPITNSTGTILTLDQAHNLIHVTSEMLQGIDWAGSSNYGTLRSIFNNTADTRASIISVLPPHMSANLPIPMGTMIPSTLPFRSQTSRVAESRTNTVMPDPTYYQLQGVRAKTAAELFQDPVTGDLFYFGVGGARIPVVTEQVEGVKFDGQGPVMPGDSASQIGVAHIPGTAADMRSPMSQTGVGRNRLRPWDDKPSGFW